jgi:hypothetical protein
MFRNESVYPDAHTFNPGRFLKDGQINPEVKDPEALFGWGRRFLFFLSFPMNANPTTPSNDS